MGTAPESAGCATNPLYVGIDDHPNVLSILPQVELFSFAPWTKVQMAAGTRTPVDSPAKFADRPGERSMLRETAAYCDNDFDACVGSSDLHTTVVRLLTSALGHLERDRAAAERCVEQAAELLGGQTTRHSPDMAAQTGMVRGGLAPWQIKQLRTHITENLASPIALEELAAICRLSGSHFSRAFKTSFGDPPHSYIMRQRIEEAKRLMLEREESLSQIALACGFADQSHFCRSFRRAEGDSPNFWRRQHASGPRVAMAD